MESNNTTNINTVYNLKPSKSDIIQRLLDTKQITVEEAMTLMANDFMPMPTMPYNPPSLPNQPWSPNTPWIDPLRAPWITYCQSHTGGSSDLNTNWTSK